MQLGKLKTEIRSHKGPVTVKVTLAGVTVDVPIQKAGFMADTLASIWESKTDETGLTFNNGSISEHGQGEPATVEAVDADDLLGPESPDDEFDDLFA